MDQCKARQREKWRETGGPYYVAGSIQSSRIQVPKTTHAVLTSAARQAATGFAEQTSEHTNHWIGGQTITFGRAVCLVMPIPVVPVRPMVGIQVPAGPVPVAVAVAVDVAVARTAAIGATSHWPLAARRGTVLRHR